jgi:hypothetical protein
LAVKDSSNQGIISCGPEFCLPLPVVVPIDDLIRGENFRNGALIPEVEPFECSKIEAGGDVGFSDLVLNHGSTLLIIFG